MNRVLTVLAALLALAFTAIAVCMVYPAWADLLDTSAVIDPSLRSG